MDNLIKKLTSRKFWFALAAGLYSFGNGIAGVITGNETLMVMGGVCCVVATSIYVAAEAYVDGKGAASQTVSVNASTNSAATVERLLKND